MQPPAQQTPDPYASKVHVNLYVSTGVPQELAGDSRGDAGSDLSATPAFEFDQSTGYASVGYGSALADRDYAVTTASRAVIGSARPDGSCDATDGVTVDIPASGSPAIWTLPGGVRVGIERSETAWAGSRGTGSALEVQPELKAATPWNCAQAATLSDSGEVLDSTAPTSFTYLPYLDHGPSESDEHTAPQPQPQPVAEPTFAQLVSVGTRLRRDRSGPFISRRPSRRLVAASRACASAARSRGPRPCRPHGSAGAASCTSTPAGRSACASW